MSRMINDWPETPFEPAWITIGNFDGCHAGHREIFRRTREHARAVGGVSVVYTFNPHPGSDLKAPDPDRVKTFLQILLDKNMTAIVRKSKGADILAACGQLRARQMNPGIETG